jgi:hypothetical protein
MIGIEPRISYGGANGGHGNVHSPKSLFSSPSARLRKSVRTVPGELFLSFSAFVPGSFTPHRATVM